MKFVQRVKNVIFSPRKTFQNILAEGFSMMEPVGLVVGITFLNVLLAGIGVVRGIDAITDFLSERVHIFPSPPIHWQIDISSFTGVIFTAFLGVAVIVAIYSLVPWIINAGIGHISAKYLFNGLGDYESLLAMYGYSHVAALTLTVGLLVFIASPVVGIFVILAMELAQWLWTLLLRTFSVSEVYGLDIGRSFICAIMPYLLLFVFVFAMTGVPFIFYV